MDKDTAVQKIRELFSRPAPNTSLSLGQRVGSIKLDAHGTTIRDTLEIAMQDRAPLPVEAQLALVKFLSEITPEAHITFFGSLDPDKEEPPYQCEVVCEATDWKRLTLGDETLEGLLKQLSEL